MAHIFALLSGPVASLISKPLDQSLLPKWSPIVGDEALTIVPPDFCLSHHCRNFSGAPRKLRSTASRNAITVLLNR